VSLDLKLAARQGKAGRVREECDRGTNALGHDGGGSSAKTLLALIGSRRMSGIHHHELCLLVPSSILATTNPLRPLSYGCIIVTSLLYIAARVHQTFFIIIDSSQNLSKPYLFDFSSFPRSVIRLSQLLTQLCTSYKFLLQHAVDCRDFSSLLYLQLSLSIFVN